MFHRSFLFLRGRCIHGLDSEGYMRSLFTVVVVYAILKGLSGVILLGVGR